MEEVIETGGYFAAVEKGFFVDSAKYPNRNGDGIARDGKGGVGADSLIERDADYMAPVCDHFGDNHLPAGLTKLCDPIDGCTLCKPEKIVYIDELDPADSANARLEKTLPYFNRLVPRVRKVRSTGSAALALAYVATGRFDAYIERGISLWDIAAGGLIVECAGGEFWRKPIAGMHKFRMIASNGLIHNKLPRPN